MDDKQQVIFLRTKMLGAMLRKARLEAGKSLKETSQRLGISTSTLSSYEYGRKAISLPELEFLAYSFDLPLGHFLDPDRFSEVRGDGFDPASMISLRQRIIGAQIRSRRNALNLSLKALSGRAGMPASRLSAYERGERGIPLPELEVIVDGLDLPLDELIDREGPVGEWLTTKRAFERFVELPQELQEFISEPANRSYLELARRFSELPLQKLRTVAEVLLDITL
jgi:transcriptional regulator with XRE-family HTH domain